MSDMTDADILFEDAADLLVLIRVNHRAESLVAENLGEQRLVHAAVEQVHSANAFLARLGGALEFRNEAGWQVGPLFAHDVLGLGDGKLVRQFDRERRRRREVNDLCCGKLLRDLDGRGVGSSRDRCGPRRRSRVEARSARCPLRAGAASALTSTRSTLPVY